MSNIVKKSTAVEAEDANAFREALDKMPAEAPSAYLTPEQIKAFARPGTPRCGARNESVSCELAPGHDGDHEGAFSDYSRLRWREGYQGLVLGPGGLPVVAGAPRPWRKRRNWWLAFDTAIVPARDSLTIVKQSQVAFRAQRIICGAVRGSERVRTGVFVQQLLIGQLMQISGPVPVDALDGSDNMLDICYPAMYASAVIRNDNNFDVNFVLAL